MYKPYALELVENDKAYYAFDTPEELDAVREQQNQWECQTGNIIMLQELRLKTL